MFCFDNIAKAIIGKPCTSLVASVGNTSRIPPEIASIVSLRFTFVVTFTERSFETLDKVFFIKSIVQAYGRDRLLPQMQQNVNLLSPSTPIKPNTSPNVSPLTIHSFFLISTFLLFFNCFSLTTFINITNFHFILIPCRSIECYYIHLLKTSAPQTLDQAKKLHLRLTLMFSFYFLIQIFLPSSIIIFPSFSLLII
jgi:hypothetical protein